MKNKEIETQTFLDWVKGINKKNVAQRVWQMPVADWEALDKEEILKSLPTFIQKVKAAGYTELTTRKYEMLLKRYK